MADARRGRAARFVAMHDDVGRFVHHWDTPEHVGTITGVTVIAGGWPYYVVEWPATAPDWWGRQLSPNSRSWRFA